MLATDVSYDPHALPGDVVAFLAERHLGTLTTLRPDGSPHVVPVGFSFDPVTRAVRIICSEGGRKVRNIDAGSRAVVCQVDGARWVSLEGPAVVLRRPDEIDDAAERYGSRYQAPRVNPNRVAIRIDVDRILGNGGKRSR